MIINDAVLQRLFLLVPLLLTPAVLPWEVLSVMSKASPSRKYAALPERCVTKVNGMNTNKCVSDGHYENQ